MDDFERGELPCEGTIRCGDVVNLPRKLLGNCRTEAIDFGWRSLRDEFDTAVRKVFHKSSHSKTLCDVPRGPAKADPLDVASVINMSSDGQASGHAWFPQW